MAGRLLLERTMRHKNTSFASCARGGASWLRESRVVGEDAEDKEVRGH